MPDIAPVCPVCGSPLSGGPAKPCPGCGFVSNPLDDGRMGNLFAPAPAHSQPKASPIAKTPRDVLFESLRWGLGAAVVGALVLSLAGLAICLGFGFDLARGLQAGAHFGAILGAVFGLVWGALDSLDRPLLWGPGIGAVASAPIGLLNHAFLKSTTFMPEVTLFESIVVCVMAGTIGGFAIAIFKPEE